MLCTLIVRQNRKTVPIFFFFNARHRNVGKRDEVARKNNIVYVKQKKPKSISTPYIVRRCRYKKLTKRKGVVWRLMSSYSYIVTAYDALNYWIFQAFLHQRLFLEKIKIINQLSFQFEKNSVVKHQRFYKFKIKI